MNWDLPLSTYFSLLVGFAMFGALIAGWIIALLSQQYTWEKPRKRVIVRLEVELIEDLTRYGFGSLEVGIKRLSQKL